MSRIADRIKAARSKLGLTQADAASKFAIPIGSLRKYESGPSEPGSEAISGFVRGGINANWLLTGEGEMFLTRKQQLAAMSHEEASRHGRLAEKLTYETLLDSSVVSMAKTAASSDSGSGVLIDNDLLSACHAACSKVYGDEFISAVPLMQLEFAVDLYNLLVKISAQNGGLEQMKRLEMNGLVEQLKVFIKLGWNRKFPPPTPILPNTFF